MIENPLNIYASAEPSTGKIIWLFGRPGTGKTTVANELIHHFKSVKLPAILLDGDDLRRGINEDLSFNMLHRKENIRRSAEMAKLLASQGFIVICSLITPTNLLQHYLSELLNGYSSCLVWLNAPLEICMLRDPKGMYRRALNGDIDNFTGINSPFEFPEQYDLMIDTNLCSPSEAAGEIINHMK